MYSRKDNHDKNESQKLAYIIILAKSIYKKIKIRHTFETKCERMKN